MTITSRILGYEITLEKPTECSICLKNGDLEILDRVVDNDNDTLKYALILKCRNCHELFMVTYLIGNVKQLEEIQRISKQTPIKPIK